MNNDSIVKFDPIEDAWLNVNTIKHIDLSDNLLFKRDKFLEEHVGVREVLCMRNPEYIGYTAYQLLGIRLDPFQMVIQQELWNHSFPMLVGSRGCGKSFVLGLFALLSCVLNKEYKVIIAGASFRQSKQIFEYAEKLWANAPILRSMCSKGSGTSKDIDRWTFRINDSTITAIPIGTGEKIRGLRSNCIIVDEMASHNPVILEEVIFGFGAVASDPTDKVIERAKKEKAAELGINLYEDEEVSAFSKNKAIVTGTADFYFNHYYDYWKKYKAIVESKGDINKIEEIFGGEIPEAFNWEEFCIIRLPYSLLPKGFMEDEVVARAKVQMPESLYLKEYEAVFVEDSDGFFQRSLIEQCVASSQNVDTYNWVPYCYHPFDAMVRGDPHKQYTFGVDPAAKNDNFAVVILEVYEDHNRIVHCWTTNEVDFHKRRKNGFVQVDDYYTFCVQKIRELVNVFPTNAIGIDTQGGGYAIMERFRDESILLENQQPIYEYIDWDKPKDTDSKRGNHIVYPIQFANAQWMHDSNWGLRGDLEARRLLFPQYDPLTAELSIAEDKMRMQKFAQDHGYAKELVLYDSLEDCSEEIEDLKDELTNIVYSRTPAGRERWDVPDVKTERNKKVGGKKDRYSALLIANYLAREVRTKSTQEFNYETAGGLAKNISKPKENTPMYSAPDWFQVGW